jgi:hypothetical protein
MGEEESMRALIMVPGLVHCLVEVILLLHSIELSLVIEDNAAKKGHAYDLQCYNICLICYAHTFCTFNCSVEFKDSLSC